ncbi:MAG: HAD hydrolase family protein [Planctomycetota bacterium]
MHTDAHEWPGDDTLRAIELLVLDFDGVLTDNRVWVDQDGRESVACSRGDGMGMQLLVKAGVSVYVMSKERNPVVRARCDKLGIPFQQGQDDKGAAIGALADERAVALKRVAYVGNDVNDLAPMARVGLPIAVADAEPLVLEAARVITNKPGGRGAVREVCDALMRARGADPAELIKP